MKILQSNWLCALVGAICYLAVTVLVWPRLHVPPRAAAAAAVAAEHIGTPGASWNFKNPEVNELVADLQAQKESLNARERQLNELAARLDAERQEITVVTQTVARLQQDFDQQVVRVRAEETANLKRLAKIYSAMSPEGATTILKELPDEQFVKILVFMKDSDTAPILESLAKQGDKEAKRAATITERLRLSITGQPKQS
jgi:flagellar motility protein MotE (MotC chaperone)